MHLRQRGKCTVRWPGHGGLRCVPETGTKWGGGEGYVMRGEVSFGSAESEAPHQVRRGLPSIFLKHLPASATAIVRSLTNISTSEGWKQISVLRGRAKNPIITFIITLTWPAKIGAAPAVETPATCERGHLSLSEGKSTARYSSVVATSRTHGVCYVHIMYALTEAFSQHALYCWPATSHIWMCFLQAQIKV